jgi:hypothetical protein
MLGHRHRHHRQLLDLMTRRAPHTHMLGVAEDMPAAAPDGPVHDDLIDRPRGQQRTALALMPILRAVLAPRPILAPLRRAARQIAAGGKDE